jgi:hypothetical protein
LTGGDYLPGDETTAAAKSLTGNGIGITLLDG